MKSVSKIETENTIFEIFECEFDNSTRYVWTTILPDGKIRKRKVKVNSKRHRVSTEIYLDGKLISHYAITPDA